MRRLAVAVAAAKPTTANASGCRRPPSHASPAACKPAIAAIHSAAKLPCVRGRAHRSSGDRGHRRQQEQGRRRQHAVVEAGADEDLVREEDLRQRQARRADENDRRQEDHRENRRGRDRFLGQQAGERAFGRRGGAAPDHEGSRARRQHEKHRQKHPADRRLAEGVQAAEDRRCGSETRRNCRRQTSPRPAPGWSVSERRAGGRPSRRESWRSPPARG